ncbi:MAG TPA: hypothetical protein VLT36_21390, partial [Candidatus Dormibacteraeota bacterium]|nr:hypothetical protein [Candidatus Dormibacteraeota bacterium]
ERLRKTSTETLEPISRADLNSAGVGHVRFPLPALVYGSVSENAARANAHARSLLGRFEADGSVRYHPASTDLAKTHYTNEATGLASAVVRDLLDAAVFVGDRALINQALDRLRALNKFRNGVPRGAQTWECPLHTPDILASAQMVRAYTLGYELTGETDFLEQAKYWAWTGVPFVYLVNPADKPIGLYGTIAVFGATQWKAPVWLGMPVQWCGLVYADALYRLVRDDPKGPWKTIADGITASGIQQSWPDNHEGYVGLLPDSFVLRGQHRNGPSINPATLQACAVRYFVGAPAYDFHCFRQNNVLVHAPGEISAATEGSGRISFEVQSWVGMHPYYVLINGLKAEPRLELNGKASALDSESEYHEKEGWLILHLNGTGKIGLEL